ncbi:MAG: glycosyltransferase family 9 protein [Candidatus Omnitrophota bacterium]
MLKRVLVVNPFGIGDVLFSMALVEAVKRSSPDTQIGFVCNERTEALVRMNHSVSDVFVFNRDRFRALRKEGLVPFLRELGRLLSEVRKSRFDTMIDLSLGREYNFFAMCLGIKKRIGLDHKGRGVFLTQKIKIAGYAGRHVADTQLSLLKFMNISYDKKPVKVLLEVSSEMKKRADQLLREAGIGGSDPVIAVAPGGGKSWGKDAIFKQWDPGRFAKAVDRFCEKRGHRVILLGDAGERELLERTASSLRAKAVIFAGEALEAVAALLLRSELLLCNDGGLLHLANALGVKTVSIFGPVDEKVYGPYHNGAAREVVTQSVPCRPCYKNFHFPPCPYNRRCLEDLPVEKVVQALEKVA